MGLLEISISLSVASTRPLETCSVQTRRNFLPWITPALRREMRCRDNLHKDAKMRRDSSDLWKLFKTKRNTVNRLLRDAKKKYFHDLLDSSKSNTRLFWQTMNTATKRKSQSSPPLPISGDDLSKHFSSVVSSTDTYKFWPTLSPKISTDSNFILQPLSI